MPYALNGLLPAIRSLIAKFGPESRKVDLFFDESQMEEVRSWLKEHCTSGLSTR